MKRGVLLLTLGAAVASPRSPRRRSSARSGRRSATASSHREAPLIADDPAADNTDVYAFVSPDKPNTVTIIANYIPFEDPAGGPNYYRFDPTVLYALNVDNNGDGREDVAYQFRFKTQVREPEHVPLQHGADRHAGEPGREPERQADVHGDPGDAVRARRRLGSNLRVPPTNIGPRSNSATYDAVPGRRRPRRRPQGLRRAARRSVLRRPGSIFDLGGLRPFNSLHVIPLANERGHGRRPQLQHAHDRDPGSEDGSAQGSAGGRDDRDLRERQPAEDPDPPR